MVFFKTAFILHPYMQNQILAIYKAFVRFNWKLSILHITKILVGWQNCTEKNSIQLCLNPLNWRIWKVLDATWGRAGNLSWSLLILPPLVNSFQTSFALYLFIRILIIKANTTDIYVPGTFLIRAFYGLNHVITTLFILTLPTESTNIRTLEYYFLRSLNRSKLREENEMSKSTF